MAALTIKSLKRLFYVNRGVWTLLALNVIFSISSLFVPADFFSLLASISEALLRPWTFLTYMFCQVRVGHCLLNLLCLFLVGSLASRTIDSIGSFLLYLTGGIAGALFFGFFYSAIPAEYAVGCTLKGSSASIYAMLIYSSLRQPDLKINLFGVFNPELKWLVAVLMTVNILGLAGENFAANFAHLGGCFGGAIYFVVNRFSRMNRGFYRNNDNPELDEIMTKVRLSGYSSLDDNERKILIDKSKG